MKKLAIIVLVTLCLSIFFNCSSKRQSAEAVTTDSTKVDSTATRQIDSTVTENVAPQVQIEKDTVLDNAARFIAGLPQLYESSYSALEKDKYWIEYKQSMDANWKKMSDTRLSKIATWEKDVFSKSIEDSLTLFYPFSGPDFLHANFLFPRAPKYFLAAL